MTQSIRKIMACRTLAHSNPHVLNTSNITTETCPPRSKKRKTQTTSPSHSHNSLQIPQDFWLVGGIPTPLKNDGVRQLGWWHSIPKMMGSQNYHQIPWFQNVPKHQAVIIPHFNSYENSLRFFWGITSQSSIPYKFPKIFGMSHSFWANYYNSLTIINHY